MKRILAASALGLIAAPAFAGSLVEPTPEPVPVPVVQAAPASLWSGVYGGAQFGYGWMDGDSEAGDYDGEDWLGGVHLGWQNANGNFVYGLEGDYNYSEMELGGTELDNLSHIKAKAGYDFGRTLVYATLGGAYADAGDLGDDWGWAAGAGVDYMVTDRVSLGAEALYHQFDDFGDTGGDLDGTTLQAKVSYHF